jgi:predicted dehydrogenase
VTPNHLHFDVSAAALRGGLHVISDKPATLNLAQAQELADIVAASGKLYGLTYTYTGYPMVREAREIVARGDLGAVRKVVVEYSQGWLSRPLEREDNKQASWRSDPAQSGVGGCIGDIGVHAFNIAEFITGQPGRAPVRGRRHRGAGPRPGRRLQRAAAVRGRRARRADRLADLGGRAQRPEDQRLWREGRPDLVA